LKGDRIMPRTKKKPVPQSATSQPPTTNGPASEVFTLAEAAAYLRIAEAEVLRMIHEQALPARQVGTEWRFFKNGHSAMAQQRLASSTVEQGSHDGRGGDVEG
jgi:excisionase family DNA binding protein